MIDVSEREALMVDAYGEVCKVAQAARLLSRDRNTIKKMMEDGRLEAACEGTRVDVRSIARYIAAPKQEDFEARKRRLKMKYGSEWAV